MNRDDKRFMVDVGFEYIGVKIGGMNQVEKPFFYLSAAELTVETFGFLAVGGGLNIYVKCLEVCVVGIAYT